MSAGSRVVLVQACLNGSRHRDEHEGIPLSPAGLASDGERAVAAGAASLHVHPRLRDGSETLDPALCGEVIDAIREVCPRVPVGLTTAAWIEPDPERRMSAIAQWSALPDFVSVNFSENGVADLCDLLSRRGIGIEAGLWSIADAHRFVESGIADRCCRVLVEVFQRDADDAVAAAAAIEEVLVQAGMGIRRLHHGMGIATWRVLDAALDHAHDIRVGLEDTLHLADGTVAHDNAQLVKAAVDLVRQHGHRPATSN